MNRRNVNEVNKAKLHRSSTLAQQVRETVNKHRAMETPEMANERKEQEQQQRRAKPETVLHFGLYMG